MLGQSPVSVNHCHDVHICNHTYYIYSLLSLQALVPPDTSAAREAKAESSAKAKVAAAKSVPKVKKDDRLS